MIVICTVGYFYKKNLCVNNMYVLRLLFILELLICLVKLKLIGYCVENMYFPVI